jgi:hypothetical protein
MRIGGTRSPPFQQLEVSAIQGREIYQIFMLTKTSAGWSSYNALTTFRSLTSCAAPSLDAF